MQTIGHRPLTCTGLAGRGSPPLRRLGSVRSGGLRQIKGSPHKRDKRAIATMAAALPALPLAAAGGGPVGIVVLLASLLVGTLVWASKRQRSGGLSAIPGPHQHPLLGNFFELG